MPPRRRETYIPLPEHSKKVEHQPAPSHRHNGDRMGEHAIKIVSLITIASASAALIHTLTNQHESHTAAQSTLELYDETDIAIIPYGMEEADAAKLANEIETTFNTMTEGLITIDVHVIEPSPLALNTYDKVNDADCVPQKNTESYGSYIADQTMPELGGYDKVVAFNADPSCNSEVMGVATLPGRYAEVFETTRTWDELELHGGTQEVQTETEGIFSTPYLYSPVSTGMHEILHLYGLGHSGLFTTPADYKGPMVDLYTYSPEVNTSLAFDIPAMVAQKEYIEYGGMDVMGRGIISYSKKLMPIEEYILNWPERDLKENTAIQDTNLNETSFQYSLNDEANHIALYSLNQPLLSKDSTNEFHKIAFIPTEGSDGTTGLLLYLMDNGGNFALLGEVVNLSQTDTHYELTFNTQKLAIDLSYSTQQFTISQQ